ncbi:MAG: GNAT family N-acetyltransferase [Xanthomonadaceae bacterium]|nr:GNAT family N-acetyltransferase [Xanthomonadaceae bacterium]
MTKVATTLDDRTEIRRLDHAEIGTAARICARSMRDNPIHVRVFGAAPGPRERRLERFFAAILRYIEGRGVLLGAGIDNHPVGVLGMLPPAACMPAAPDGLRLFSDLLACNSPLGLLRLYRWLSTWAEHDLPVPHWHLGPLAVAPEHQNRGIGTRLLRHGFSCTAASSAALYLETDKPENVAFYARRGFTVVATVPVLTTPSWLMRRG